MRLVFVSLLAALLIFGTSAQKSPLDPQALHPISGGLISAGLMLVLRATLTSQAENVERIAASTMFQHDCRRDLSSLPTPNPYLTGRIVEATAAATTQI